MSLISIHTLSWGNLDRCPAVKTRTHTHRGICTPTLTHRHTHTHTTTPWLHQCLSGGSRQKSFSVCDRMVRGRRWWKQEILCTEIHKKPILKQQYEINMSWLGCIVLHVKWSPPHCQQKVVSMVPPCAPLMAINREPGFLLSSERFQCIQRPSNH